MEYRRVRDTVHLGTLATLVCTLTACGPGGDPEQAAEGTRIDDQARVRTPGDARPEGERAQRAHDSGTVIVDLGDGRAEAILSVVPTRYRAEDGTWKAVSDELVRSTDGGWENRTNTLRSFLPALATGRTAVDRTDGGLLVFVPRGMGWCDSHDACTTAGAPSGVSAVIDEQMPGRLVYPQVYPGVDEEFRVLALGLKHDVVLTTPPTAPPGVGEDGFITFAWELRVSRDLTPFVNDRPVLEAVSTPGAISWRDGSGSLRMAIAVPRILASPDRDDPHAVEETMGTFRIVPIEDHYLLDLKAPLEWLLVPDRSYPVRLDPTVVLQPGALGHTGAVSFDEVASYDRQVGRPVSGTLAATNPSWRDVEGYARFSTAEIAQCMSVDDVDLLVWLANHDNNGVTALPLHMDIHGASADPEFATDQQLYDSILAGPIYASELIPRTGPPFDIGNYCLDSFVYREYELGPMAATDLTALLPDEWFAIGFRSRIGDDPDFDHVDYIGYPENVDGACGFEPFPNSRISLRVTGTSKAAPIAAPGGPYSAECTGAIQLDGSGSFADGSPLSFSWTTDCPGGTFDDGTSASPVLTVALGTCLVDCTTTLMVSDGCGSSTATSAVTIRDTTSPAAAPGPLDGSCLWAPNHKYVCATDLAAFVETSDECAEVTLTVTACSSDQPDDARDPAFPGENGDGHTFDDCVIAPDARSLCVRSERLGTDEAGRHYGVTLLADDGCSVATPFAASFYVPHDRRSPREECLDAKSSPYLEIHDELPWAATP